MRRYTANMCIGNTTKSLYFLNTTKSCIFWNIIYTALSVRTTVCMIWFFFQKYNWKYHMFALLGTVTKSEKGTRSAWEKAQWKVVFFTSNIFAVYLPALGFQKLRNKHWQKKAFFFQICKWSIFFKFNRKNSFWFDENR